MKIIFNGEPRDAVEGETIAELLKDLNLESKHVAVEVNLNVVPRTSHVDYVLQDGDRLEVVSLVGGG